MNDFLAAANSLAWSNRRKLPKTSGVYGFVAPDGELLYIGATIDLRERMKKHHVRSVLTDDTVILWHALPEAMVFETERLLIVGLQPKFNDGKTRIMTEEAQAKRQYQKRWVADKRAAQPEPERPTLICPWCQSAFTPKRVRKTPQFCCDSCRASAYQARKRAIAKP